MKWFEHRTTDRNELESKLIKRKFGLEGYGIWNQLQEIIGENMEINNFNEWGYVAEKHTMQSLAEEIGCDLNKFREFVKFCDGNLILEKKNNRLFCQFALDRMNEYARKIAKKEQSEISEIPKNQKKGRNNTTQHHTTPHNTTPNINNTGDKPPEIKTWQEKAIRAKEFLKLKNLPPGFEDRWFKLFRDIEGTEKTKNISQALTYVVDHPTAITPEQKILLFFSLIQKGF